MVEAHWKTGVPYASAVEGLPNYGCELGLDVHGTACL